MTKEDVRKPGPAVGHSGRVGGADRPPGVVMPAGPLTPFERDVLALSLDSAGSEAEALKAQLARVEVVAREGSGVGVFVHLSVPESEVHPSLAGRTFLVGDVVADVPGLLHGVGFVVLVTGGRLDLLEGYTFGEERWPTTLDGSTLRRTGQGGGG